MITLSFTISNDNNPNEYKATARIYMLMITPGLQVLLSTQLVQKRDSVMLGLQCPQSIPVLGPLQESISEQLLLLWQQ